MKSSYTFVYFHVCVLASYIWWQHEYIVHGSFVLIWYLSKMVNFERCDMLLIYINTKWKIFVCTLISYLRGWANLVRNTAHTKSNQPRNFLPRLHGLGEKIARCSANNHTPSYYKESLIIPIHDTDCLQLHPLVWYRQSSFMHEAEMASLYHSCRIWLREPS